MLPLEERNYTQWINSLLVLLGFLSFEEILKLYMAWGSRKLHLIYWPEVSEDRVWCWYGKLRFRWGNPRKKGDTEEIHMKSS